VHANQRRAPHVFILWAKPPLMVRPISAREGIGVYTPTPRGNIESGWLTNIQEQLDSERKNSRMPQLITAKPSPTRNAAYNRRWCGGMTSEHEPHSAFGETTGPLSLIINEGCLCKTAIIQTALQTGCTCPKGNTALASIPANEKT